jgi:hypothetical protein
MSVFDKELKNLQTISETRELVNTSVFCTTNMDDRQLREAIVQDVLAFTMLNVETKQSFNLDGQELMRFMRIQSERLRVARAFKHPEISGLVKVSNPLYAWVDSPESRSNTRIWMSTDRSVLQAAMDYCGVWYDGYMPTDMSGVIVVNTEALETAVEKHGGIDNLATALAMDLEGTHINDSEAIH